MAGTRRPLRLETLEARDVAAASPAIAGPVPVNAFSVGKDAGGDPLVNLYNTVGGLVRSFEAYSPAFHGGVRVATADINGDNIKDVITAPGPGGGPDIRVFDGASGAADPRVLGLLAGVHRRRLHRGRGCQRRWPGGHHYRRRRGRRTARRSVQRRQ